MPAPWRIKLLGELRAERGETVLCRFRTQKTGALLAYLAFHSDRAHPRPALIELLWPEEELHATQVKLRMALSWLRRQFDQPAPDVGGTPPGGVILANRATVQLSPAAVTTDVGDFEATLRAAARAGSGDERLRLLSAAVELYAGELLPGYYEPWIMPERQRLSEAFLGAASRLTAELERAGDLSRALQTAWRAAAMDPLREESQYDLLRLLIATGQPEAALRQYEQLRQLLHREWGAEPAPSLRSLIHPLAQQARNNGGGTGRPPIRLTSPSLVPGGAELNGTVTVLLVGIERAGGPEEEQDPGLTAALERLRPLLRGHGGHELAVSGEVLQTVFGRASDALAAAIAGQRATGGASRSAGGHNPETVNGNVVAASRRRPALLRMAVHTGEVDPREEPPGSSILRHAAHLLLAVQPGQILLSETSAVLLQDRLPPCVRLTRVGRYHLCHDAASERLFRTE